MFMTRSVAHLGLTRQIRNFSQSIMRRDAKPVSPAPAEIPKTSTTPKTPTAEEDYRNVIGRRMYRVTEIDKRVLLWMKRYPNKEAIPVEIPGEVMLSVRNKARIRAANWMIVATIIGCCIAIYSGKQAQKSGDSLTKRNLDWHKKINDEYQASLANAEAKKE